MIYTHVLNRGGLAVRSPLDQIDGSHPRAPAARPRPIDAAPSLHLPGRLASPRPMKRKRMHNRSDLHASAAKPRLADAAPSLHAPDTSPQGGMRRGVNGGARGA
jgi:hypothetical protein